MSATMPNYSVHKVGRLHHIERLDYPKFSADIDLSRNIPFLQNLNFQEECSARKMLEVINEATDYVLKFKATD